MLLLLVSLATAATDIGENKPLGVGVATGPATVSATVKYFLDDKGAVVGYAGTNGAYHGLRAGYQREFVNWGQDWTWGQVGMYWHVAADVHAYTGPYYGSSLAVGAGGGVGATLKLQSIPLEVFAEAGLGFFPINGYCQDVAADTAAATGFDFGGVCYVGGMGASGVRWYF